MEKTKRRVCRAPLALTTLSDYRKTRRAGRQPPFDGLDLVRHFTLARKIPFNNQFR
ncbi:hypothetical protein [Paraburkholderia flagellata]|uniref:hypothetical protein n=1 Tax=Paraburkholderia flagellata TaxID=2883241 RepID=UPI001F3B570C|nr:hypothetical protein [Paraburkholderia flagellata]